MSYNDITVYLRPVFSVQPYIVNNCAVWMVNSGMALNLHIARTILKNAESKNPPLFRYLISEYHRIHDYKFIPTYKYRDVNKPISRPGPYGEDPHMYY